MEAGKPTQTDVVSVVECKVCPPIPTETTSLFSERSRPRRARKKVGWEKSASVVADVRRTLWERVVAQVPRLFRPTLPMALAPHLHTSDEMCRPGAAAALGL